MGSSALTWLHHLAHTCADRNNVQELSTLLPSPLAGRWSTMRGEMEQFLAVAVAHFLALLIPGVDFFLIARTAMTSGWRNATGACLGIAVANGLFITAAFSGVSLIQQPAVLAVIQLAGGGFLIFVGVAFFKSSPRIDFTQGPSPQRTTWIRNFGLGMTSGLLNPKKCTVLCQRRRRGLNRRTCNPRVLRRVEVRDRSDLGCVRHGGTRYASRTCPHGIGPALAHKDHRLLPHPVWRRHAPQPHRAPLSAGLLNVYQHQTSTSSPRTLRSRFRSRGDGLTM